MPSETLDLHKEFKTSWLIQRLHKPPREMVIAGKAIDNPFSFGGGMKNGGLSDDAMKLLRDVFSFDYMGSAEFEFGAVPAALSFLAKQSGEGALVADELRVGKGESVYYVCPQAYLSAVKKRLTELRRMNPHVSLKEHCGLKEYFDSTDDRKEYVQRNVGWLELDNGFAFFVDKEMFDKFCSLFGIAMSKVAA